MRLIIYWNPYATVVPNYKRENPRISSYLKNNFNIKFYLKSSICFKSLQIFNDKSGSNIRATIDIILQNITESIFKY